MLPIEMLRDVSDHKLEILTHFQLKNLVMDIRNEALKVGMPASLKAPEEGDWEGLAKANGWRVLSIDTLMHYSLNRQWPNHNWQAACHDIGLDIEDLRAFEHEGLLQDIASGDFLIEDVRRRAQAVIRNRKPLKPFTVIAYADGDQLETWVEHVWGNDSADAWEVFVSTLDEKYVDIATEITSFEGHLHA